MKIALISEHASPLAPLGGIDCGGQNVYVAQIATHLGRAGHRVDVFTRRDSPYQAALSVVAPGVRVVHVPAGPARRVAKEQLLDYMDEFGEFVVSWCRRHGRYDVVHANFFMSGLVALRMRAACGSPFVITFHALGRLRREHQGSADGFPAQRMDIEQTLVNEADRIVAECPQDAADLARLYRADPRRVALAPCGVDTRELAPEALERCRARLGQGLAGLALSPDDFIVLQLGRLVPRKGIDNVVRALARLRCTHGIDATLLIAGGESAHPDPCLTPEVGRLSALANAEGVADRVRFLGCRARDQLREVYGAADVFVTTPWYEPFGITPLEAMACARPVVGAAVGGIQYSVVDGVTGFLVPPRDPEQLAARLARLRNDSALRVRMGQAGLRRVRARFTWSRVTATLLGIYADVMAATPASAGLAQQGSDHVRAAG